MAFVGIFYTFLNNPDPTDKSYVLVICLTMIVVADWITATLRDAVSEITKIPFGVNIAVNNPSGDVKLVNTGEKPTEIVDLRDSYGD